MPPKTHPDYPTRPLRPNEVLAIQKETFPEEVFVAVNGLIAEHLQGQYARFTVKALQKRMEELGLDRKNIADRGLTRVGSLYEEAGWDVGYHSASFDDDCSFDPYYVFGSQGPRSW